MPKRFLNMLDQVVNWFILNFRQKQLNTSTSLTERGLIQKTRRLMDENSVFFKMFLILLFLIFIALGSESQISVFKQCQSNTQMSGFF